MTNESEEVTLLTRRRLMDKKGYSDFLYPGELTKKTWKIWQLMKNSKLRFILFSMSCESQEVEQKACSNKHCV